MFVSFGSNVLPCRTLESSLFLFAMSELEETSIRLCHCALVALDGNPMLASLYGQNLASLEDYWHYCSTIERNMSVFPPQLENRASWEKARQDWETAWHKTQLLQICTDNGIIRLWYSSLVEIPIPREVNRLDHLYYLCECIGKEASNENWKQRAISLALWSEVFCLMAVSYRELIKNPT